MDNGNALGVLFLFVGFLMLYFIPAAWAYNRNHRNQIPILLTNLFFGWTFIGWVVALIWASSDNVQPH